MIKIVVWILLVHYGLYCAKKVMAETETHEVDPTAKETLNPICKLPPQQGPCVAYTLRYFFNQTSHKCEAFVFGGCHPNANNFNNVDDCIRICEKHIDSDDFGGKNFDFDVDDSDFDRNDVDVDEDFEFTAKRRTQPHCLYPPSKGPCREHLTRFYYNPKSHSCERFIFGGCGGNRNNFRTQSECEKSCFTMKYNSESVGDSIFPHKTAVSARSEPETDICLLRPDMGPCFRIVPRFYYDNSTKKCTLFIYGGCGGNKNNFKTLRMCEAICGDLESNYKVICSLPSDRGHCNANLTRYYFNSETRQCENFTYGGCLGNRNNFATMRECTSACSFLASKTATVSFLSACSLPAERGPCNAYIPRFYYSLQSQSCEQFVYGGCGGNSNNFASVEECQNACGQKGCKPNSPISACSLFPERGPCGGYIPRFYYNMANQRCETFVYGGCGGNSNNFMSWEICQNACGPKDAEFSTSTEICSLAPERGPCWDHLTRYYHNSTTNKCEPFEFGGCGGNRNNFETFLDCINYCTPPNSLEIDVCSLPLQQGPCANFEPRYYFNPSTKYCQLFTYGGCGGNSNNFKTLQECQNACVSKGSPPDINVCALPAEIGPCTSNIERYYYNSTTQKCKRFQYSGCGGNQNNFLNKKDCYVTCEPNYFQPEYCLQPAETGPCKARYTRYYYNEITESCTKFIYGGCYGNQNNFCSKHHCKDVCIYGRKMMLDGPTPRTNNINAVERTPKKTVKKKSVCSLAAEKGPCKANLTRYFYNSLKGKCQKFTYSGCGGNKNNFASKNECKQFCA